MAGSLSAVSLGLLERDGIQGGEAILRVNARVAGIVAAATLLVAPGIAWGAELPRGPVTAQTVAAAQAESTAAQAASTAAAQAAATAGVALDQAKAAAQAAAAAASANPTPENTAA